jgi:pimeloyl-ACP methyl ester carboxylesterase
MHRFMLLIFVAAAACAQEAPAWQDPSPHQVRFVNVEEGVRLEVLDWGGSGRAIVLLAGSGNSAHVFDDFASKMTGWSHVYGITRRGHGASSQPEGGYDDQRLADDVLQVLETLGIERPVLAGHSMAGGELTTLGNQHSDRLAGLVYLDALGDPRDWPGSDPSYRELFNKLVALRPSAAAAPPDEDPRTFDGFRARQLRNGESLFPESELRNTHEISADGSMGRFKTPARVGNAIGAGQKKRDYSHIRVPVLAFGEGRRRPEDPPPPGQFVPKNDEERALEDAYDRATSAYVDRWLLNLIHNVRDVRLIALPPGTGHYVFLSQEAAVLRGMREFVTAR